LIHEVVELNMGVADALASRYRGRGIADEDLRQVAYVGLVRAAQNHDPSTGHDFLSYAVPTIRGVLRKHFRDFGWMVRPPRRIQELQAAAFEAQTKLAHRLGRSPSMQELATELCMSRPDVEEALAAEGCFTPTSLDRPTNIDSRATVGDLLGDPDPGQSAAEARVVLGPLVRQLCERDRLVLRMRFFDGSTQEEIAHEIGVTQTQVSRILGRVLGELREGLEGHP
jgi:RNA polymerase sigma-B factor